MVDDPYEFPSSEPLPLEVLVPLELLPDADEPLLPDAPVFPLPLVLPLLLPVEPEVLPTLDPVLLLVELLFEMSVSSSVTVFFTNTTDCTSRVI
jgi:hypothetical protein